jgi:hypothetical protein
MMPHFRASTVPPQWQYCRPSLNLERTTRGRPKFSFHLFQSKKNSLFIFWTDAGGQVHAHDYGREIALLIPPAWGNWAIPLTRTTGTNRRVDSLAPIMVSPVLLLVALSSATR